MTQQLRSLQGDTLDMICYRAFGRTAGVTEQVMDLNPQLSRLPPVLPSGTLVTLPDTPSRPHEPLTQLWS